MAGVIQEDGVFLTTGEMPTEAQQYGGPGIMEKAKRIIETYKTEYHPEGICISTAGMVDCEKGKITYASPLIPDYTGTEIKADQPHTQIQLLISVLKNIDHHFSCIYQF